MGHGCYMYMLKFFLVLPSEEVLSQVSHFSLPRPRLWGELGWGQVSGRALALTQGPGIGLFLLKMAIGSLLAFAFMWLLQSSGCPWNGIESGLYGLSQSFRRLAMMAGLFCYAWCGCGKLLGVELFCSCSCPCKSGHNVPVTPQQDKCYSLFCNFLSLYEWTLKG